MNGKYRLIISVLLLSMSLLACGVEAPPLIQLPIPLSSDDAEVAELGHHLVATLGPLFPLLMAPLAFSPDDLVGEDRFSRSSEDLQKDLQALFDATDKGCAKITSSKPYQFAIALSGCALTKSQQVKASGELAIVVVRDPKSGQLTMQIETTKCTIGGIQWRGKILVAISRVFRGRVDVSVPESLTLGDGHSSFTVTSFQAVLGRSDGDQAEYRFFADGIIDFAGTSLKLRLREWSQRPGESAPHFGLLVLQSGDVLQSHIIELFFSEKTIEGGYVEVRIDGLTAGQKRAEDLASP